MTPYDMNTTRFNCGHFVDVYSTAQIVIRVYFIVPVVLFGLPASCINILIFSRKQMRASLVNWFLLALSMSDFCLLLSTSVMFSAPALAELSGSLSAIEVTLFAMRWVYAIGTVVQTANVYLTVLVSFHRFLGVCYPFQARRWVNAGPVRASLIGAVLFAFMFNISRFFEMRLVSCTLDSMSGSSFVLRPGPLLFDRIYFIGYFVAAYSIVMFIVPFTVLIVVSCRIVRTLRRSNTERQRMTMMSRGSVRVDRTPSPTDGNRNSSRLLIGVKSTAFDETTTAGRQSLQIPKLPIPDVVEKRFGKRSKSSDEGAINGVKPSKRNSFVRYVSKRWSSRKSHDRTQQDSEQRSITVMLLAVVGLFFAFNTLPFVNNIVDILTTFWPDLIDRKHSFTVMVELGNLLVTLNSACIIFVYISFCSKYRTLGRKLLLCWWTAKTTAPSATDRAVIASVRSHQSNPSLRNSRTASSPRDSTILTRCPVILELPSHETSICVPSSVVRDACAPDLTLHDRSPVTTTTFTNSEGVLLGTSVSVASSLDMIDELKRDFTFENQLATVL